jgi:hypothetical protein
MAENHRRLDLVQQIDLGPVGTMAGFNYATLPKAGQLGAKFQHQGVTYQIIKLDGAADVAADATLYWLAATGGRTVFSVHNADQTAGTAGTAVGAITNTYYGIMLASGTLGS